MTEKRTKPKTVEFRLLVTLTNSDECVFTYPSQELLDKHHQELKNLGIMAGRWIKTIEPF